MRQMWNNIYNKSYSKRKRITMVKGQKEIICPCCHGSGVISDATHIHYSCGMCNGTGKVK